MIEFTAQIVSTSPLTLDAPDWARSMIHDFAESHDAAFVRIMAQRKPRTTGYRSQNAHLNGHIQTICVATYNDFDSVKMVVKMRAISRGYPFSTYHGITVPKSEADASTTECALLIDEVHQLAAEEGINLHEE